MSHLSKVFNSVPVKVPDRSGFDLSHENLFSATVGTLIPASVEEVLPGDVCSIGGSLSVELPPLATNFKGRVDARLETFFVPNRILWAGWQDFICQDATHKPVVPSFTVAASVPQVRLGTSASTLGPGTLADYLGAKQPSFTPGTTYVDVNALPFLAYHKIWDDWYRDSLVQQPFFVDGVGNNSYNQNPFKASNMPFVRDFGTLTNTSNIQAASSLLGWNGTDLRYLKQRNFAKDYFTTMTTQPQSGAASSLEFIANPDTDPNSPQGQYVGSFTIASLRTANALQKWLERNNLGGTRYYDQILAHYGVMPPDVNVNRAVLLGGMTVPVVVNSVSKTNASDSAQVDGRNPYSASTGAQFGRGLSFGKDRLVDKFEVKEHGFIITLFSLVPHAYYSTGTRRYLGRTGSGTYAFPEFAGIGDQEVYASELVSGVALQSGVLWDSNNISGYNQRFSEYKYHDDEVHGLLSDGNSLQNFVLQRGFAGIPAPTTSLLEIPTNFMDSVMIAQTSVSGFNAIVDCYFDSKFLRVLPEYSLPHL